MPQILRQIERDSGVTPRITLSASWTVAEAVNAPTDSVPIVKSPFIHLLLSGPVTDQVSRYT